MAAERRSPWVTGALAALAAAALVAAALDLAPGGRGAAAGAAAWLASRAAWPAVERAAGRGAGLVARGGGWAGAVALPLAALAPPYSTAAPGLAVATIGLFAFAAGRGAGRAAWAWTALAVALLAAAFPLLARVPDAVAPDAGAARFVWAFGLPVATLAATRLAWLRGARGALAKAMVESEIRNALVVVPFAAYVAYRGALAENLRHLPVYEWTLGVAVAAYALAAVRGRFREAAPDEPWTSAARRHAQAVRSKPDARFARAVEVFEAFVERGEARERYAAFWSEALAEAGVADEEARALVARAASAPAPPASRAIRKRVADAEARAARDKRAEAHRVLLARVVDATERRRDARARKPSV